MGAHPTTVVTLRHPALPPTVKYVDLAGGRARGGEAKGREKKRERKREYHDTDARAVRFRVKVR